MTIADLYPSPVTLDHQALGFTRMYMSQLTLNLTEGSASFKFTSEAAKDLKASLSSLMENFKAKATKSSSATKSNPQKPMEYQYMGEVFLEIFCNPNIWPSPFAAKVLITLRDDRIRLTTEAELSRVVEDVNLYLEQVE